MRAHSLVLMATLCAGPALAQDEVAPAPKTPGPAKAEAPLAAKATVAPGEAVVALDDTAKREQRRLQFIQKRRLACGCAMPRLLRHKEQEVTFDGERGMSAWVRNDGTAFLGSFQLEPDGSLQPITAPFGERSFIPPASGGDVLRSAYELVRTHATGAGEPFYLGVQTPPRTRPGDVIKVTPVGGGVPPKGDPSLLDELWVGPVDERDSERCGAFTSHRLLTTAREDSLEAAGYVVTYTPEGARPRTTLVDERHARIFGLGRVDPCEHGMPFEVTDTGPVPAQLEVRTVSATFAVGPPWRWRISGVAGELPVPVKTPEGTSLDVDDNPFLTPARDPIEGILSDDRDHIAFGAMASVVLGAGLFARMIYAARRRRGRYTADLACPSCESEMSVDLEDPETDGMFCPKCGKSSVFVSFEADGTPKAHVVELSGEHKRPEKA